MAITQGGFTIPLSYPLEGNEGLIENLFGLFDTQPIGIGSTLTIVPSKIDQVYAFDTSTGSVATLPAALGTGVQFTFYVSTLATTNSHKVLTSPLTDSFGGLIFGARTDSTNVVLGFPGTVGGTNSNTITLNRTTTGSVNKGEFLIIKDVASGVWLVRGFLSSTGASFATPYSHT